MVIAKGVSWIFNPIGKEKEKMRKMKEQERMRQGQMREMARKQGRNYSY